MGSSRAGSNPARSDFYSLFYFSSLFISQTHEIVHIFLYINFDSYDRNIKKRQFIKIWIHLQHTPLVIVFTRLWIF